MAGPATVVGGGPCGSLLSMMLADLGFSVEVFELRAEAVAAEAEEASGQAKVLSATRRSINLALSHRGVCALRRVGLAERVLARSVEMHSRFVHLADGGTATQRYGGPNEAIYSISRPEVVAILQREAARRGVVVRRGEKLVGIDEEGPVFASGARGAGPTFGCDGAFSATRRAMERLGRYETRVWYAKQGYKELSMPSRDGAYVFPPNYLHIWPRGEMMLTALPNLDGSFTATLFAPHDDLDAMERTWSADQVAHFFRTHFADAARAMPAVVDDFFANPAAPLVQVQLAPWHYRDRILCLGDASHAVLPFYGQGMNAAFEDCLALAELLDARASLPDAFAAMSASRRAAADGLSTLAAMNYRDMASNTASTLYRLRKLLEAYVAAAAPSLWKPLYSMVTFSRIPYDAVLHRHRTQEACLTALAAGLALSSATLLALAARFARARLRSS
mmetsp:Transcript_24156/g.75557  ORF Transcript_24156/g.75557 Transcript_24156/m.75557 type:complete len:449 (-) Transcript_24156:260-1606(-)